MPLISLNEEQIEWLMSEIALTETVLLEKEQQLAHLRSDVTDLRGRRTMLQTFLDALVREKLDKADDDWASTDADEGRQRTPMEMVRDEFKGMTLGDIAAKVLDEHESLMTPRELSEIIYDAKSDDEFERARNSLSAELRAGARGDAPRWRKIGRYAYASLSVRFQEVNDEEVPDEKLA